MNEVIHHSAVQIVNRIKTRKISPVEVVEAFLQRIEQLNDKINAFLYVDREGAIKEAKRLADQLVNSDIDLPLAGVPVAIKDNIVTKGIETTAGSKILKGFIPPYDSTVVERLKAAGAIIIGKTNLDEFAMGSTGENSAFGPVRNPVDLNAVAGGSSSGSAAAVGAGMVPVALGSDTGGSIRMPAALCGVVGLKPSYGRVSRYGLIAFASSLDQIGPITRTVEDAALVLSVISGSDKRDSTNILPAFSPNYRDMDIKKLKAGYIEVGDIQKEVKDVFMNNIKLLQDEIGAVEPVEMSLLKYAIPVYHVISTAEASSNLSRYDGVRYGFRQDADNTMQMYELTRSAGFGEEVKRRIVLGTFVLSAGYADRYFYKAARLRAAISKEVNENLQKVDVIVTPTSPLSHVTLGGMKRPLEVYQLDIFTVFASLAGLPAISVPAGYDGNGHPIGLQVIGRMGEEATVLKVAEFIHSLIQREARQ